MTLFSPVFVCQTVKPHVPLLLCLFSVGAHNDVLRRFLIQVVPSKVSGSQDQQGQEASVLIVSSCFTTSFQILGFNHSLFYFQDYRTANLLRIPVALAVPVSEVDLRGADFDTSRDEDNDKEDAEHAIEATSDCSNQRDASRWMC